ncbi:clathrin heavy chain 1-like isoform X2 [Lineus longissimus]|uniref:clathrin heavy chain 1-like isoform X2 n=1 Tax=Lineus longissimus TaxID=88925 RepID=UPI002B4D10F0
MEDARPPVRITELAKLPDLGIPSEQITWSRVSLTSDKWICVRHDDYDGSFQRKQTNKKQHLATLLTLCHKTPPQTWGVKADSVLVNPSLPLIALKAGRKLEVFNIQSRSLTKSCHMDEEIGYWTWVNDDVIAMVTEKYIYHWLVHSEQDCPRRMFERDRRLEDSEVVSYRVDPGMKWFALTGLYPEDRRICGVTQLYSVDHCVTQCIAAHAVYFAQYKFEWNRHPSTVLCVASRDALYGKAHVVELGPHNPGNKALTNHTDGLKFPDDTEKFDFPVQIQVSTDYRLFYVITKYGQIFICDLETSAALYSTPICTDIVITSVLNTSTQGVLGITKLGQVLSIDIKKNALIEYVREQLKKPNIANRLEKTLCR